MFMPGNQSLNTSLATYTAMLQASWFRNNMVLTVVELMFYNANERIGNVFQLHFFVDNTGTLKIVKTSLSFLPQNYDVLSDPTVVLKVLMFTGYFIMLVILFFKTLVLTVTKIKGFFHKQSSLM